MSDVVIFAPSPVLEITVEEHADDGDVHVHAGGQGVWQARILQSLGRDVVLCSMLSGETGRVLGFLLHEEGIPVVGFPRDARGGVFVTDRRGGEKVPIIESGGDALSRHEQDELYGLTLRTGLDAKLVILSGPHGESVLPADFYRRLAADLRTGGVRVVVDLAGERLDAALAGGVTVAKVSDQELLDDGRVGTKTDMDQLVGAMRALHDAGAEVVVVTRAEESALLLHDGDVHEVVAPKMEVVDSAGAGDSFVGAFCAVLADGGSVSDAALLGAAAGAQNVTRHGLGTGEAATIERLRELVTIRPLATGATS
jgi:1-phosphofructokinase